MATDEKALAKEMTDFMKALREKGFTDDMSLIAVCGDAETQEITCVPILCGGFEMPTIMYLDKLVSQVKVNGLPDRNNARQIITDENGESILLDNQADRDKYANFLLDKLKESYDGMVAEYGDTKARHHFLRNIIKSLVKNTNFNEIPLEAKTDILTEILTKTKEKTNADWIPHYDNHEILAVIEEITHLTTFGYARNDNPDVAYQ